MCVCVRGREREIGYLNLVLHTGLPQLPLLYALVSTFKADVSLKNNEGLTPLSLAAKLGEEKLAEVHIYGLYMYMYMYMYLHNIYMCEVEPGL